jgi:TonB family protein
MATTEIPPVPAEQSGGVIEGVPVLVIQLEDDLARSRLREAFWMSLVFHLVLAIALLTSPKWASSLFPKPIPVHTAEDLMRGNELTYVDMSPDRQRVNKAPKTDRISDKNRIATSRQPILDRKTLEELRDFRPPGPPGGMAALPPAPQMAQAQPRQRAATSSGDSDEQMQARLEAPPEARRSVFENALSPGQAIQQAARASTAGRGTKFSGGGGDYGLGSGAAPTARMGDLDILSDTMGVDFGPYLARIRQDIYVHWFAVMPPAAMPPLAKKGLVIIEFAIMKDGSVRGLQVTGRSGDEALDRGAYGGIAYSNPFPPLPADFGGPYLALRCRFYYNPDRGDIQ